MAFMPAVPSPSSQNVQLSQNREGDEQDDDGGNDKHKVQIFTTNGDLSNRSGLPCLGPAFLHAALSTLYTFIALLLEGTHTLVLTVGTGAEALHATPHLAVVAFDLLLIRIVAR